MSAALFMDAATHYDILPALDTKSLAQMQFDGRADGMQAQAQAHFVAMNGAPLQQPQHHQIPSHSMAQQHAPMYHSPPFHYHNGIMQPMPMPSNAGFDAHGGMMRFPQPQRPFGPAQMSSGRNKKDIKRRTKTGCLTCRQRRIKCDEGHPTCRNCTKSKRECLGYDPIFKPQTGPAVIQPAPTNSSSPNTTPPVSSTTELPPSSSSFPQSRSNFTPTTDTSDFDSAFEYGSGASLDPALSSSHHYIPNMTSQIPTSRLRSSRTVKPVTIDQLFSINGVPPRYQPSEHPQPSPLIPQSEIDDLYRLHYAPGLDKLFETTWYSTRAFAPLRRDATALDLLTQCMQHFQSQDPTATASIQSLEAQLIWRLATLPRSTLNSNAADTVLNELLPRLEIVETLLTGQFLSSTSPIPSPPTSTPQTNHVKYNEQTFWHHLGTFVSLHDDTPDPSTKPAIDHALNGMRAILGMMENRDVLYSLAIARHIGGRLDEFTPGVPVAGGGEGADGEELTKLEVARSFVELEDQKGTTQVVQRVCGMAMRGWILLRQ